MSIGPPKELSGGLSPHWLGIRRVLVNTTELAPSNPLARRDGNVLCAEARSLGYDTIQIASLEGFGSKVKPFLCC